MTINHIHHTTSLCTTCSKHIPAELFEKDGRVYLKKKCPNHIGETHLVDPDSEFYLNYQYPKRELNTFLDAICLDITNRCNLTCPHCYQLPDSTSKDPSIESIISQIKNWPGNRAAVLMGAEPTVREDLPDLIRAINEVSIRPIMILTNGVRLSKEEYIDEFLGFNNVHFTFGLNHPDYQGHTVRRKQIQGIENCKARNMSIKNISYTLEGYHQLEYCLEEIQKFNKEKQYCKMYRIRVGTEIGRSPVQDKMFMSDLVKNSRAIAEKNNWTFNPRPELGIRAHYPVEINGVLVKLIQWPDIKTLDLVETQTESWADMLPGMPISPLVHQVLLRDRLVNNKLPLLDVVPEQYRLT
jgi:organic radical activating enzyme